MVDVLDFYDNRAAETAEAQRTAKATAPKKLAAGALNESEHAILTALRKEPATSMGDLERRTGLNATALDFAFRALRDRSPSPIRETHTSLNTLRIVAVA